MKYLAWNWEFHLRKMWKTTKSFNNYFKYLSKNERYMYIQGLRNFEVIFEKDLRLQDD